MMMTQDLISLLIEQWKRIRPDLSPDSMRTSGRLLRVAKLIERRTEALLKTYNLSLWQFDVLATLRRHDRDLSPGELLQVTMLTSGAMTNRLDRLEKAGFVERSPDPNDRRGVRVFLTEAGRDLVDQVIEARFAEADHIEGYLTAEESETLATLLQKLEQGLEGADPHN
jgi:DNA-binding MarR family transcriptional regulator